MAGVELSRFIRKNMAAMLLSLTIGLVAAIVVILILRFGFPAMWPSPFPALVVGIGSGIATARLVRAPDSEEPAKRENHPAPIT